MLPLTLSLLMTATTPVAPTGQAAEDTQPWVVYEGGDGPGAGKHVLLMPMLGKILAKHHGFRCTVLFAIDPETGVIDPNNQTNIPGFELCAEADMIVLFTRFREIPDESMRHFVDYVDAGKPIFGIRTSTHAFDYRRDKESPFFRYHWRHGEWKGGFGKQILGETWVAHHGGHGSEATRGVVEESSKEHPILRGVSDVFGPTDVYRVGELPEDATVLLRGAVLAGMQPDSPPVEGPKNEPMMPIAWTRELTSPGGKPMRTICSTIGASQDLSSEDLRRLFVNACYWGLRMEEQIPERSCVDPVGTYAPTPFGFGSFTKGVRPENHAWKAKTAEAGAKK